jgi:cytochrome c oxidase subunit 4
MEHQAEHHIVGYGTFIGVWFILLALTASLVGISAMHLGNLGIAATLVITPVKASLVFYYFMHLKYENTTLKLMVFVSLAALIVFLGLLMLDYSFR